MKIINNFIIILSLFVSLLANNIFLILLLIPLLFISLVIRKYNRNLEFIYLIFLFISYILGFVFDFYDKIYYFDAIVHSLFGIVSSIFALPLLEILRKYNVNDILFNSIFILIFTLGVAGLWEIFEFTIDSFFHSNMQISLNNTMKDIISALLFSILYLILYLENSSKIDKLFIKRN